MLWVSLEVFFDVERRVFVQAVISTSLRKIVVVILALVMVSISIFVFMIVSGKRSIPYIPQHIENTLNSLNIGYKFDVEEAFFSWDSRHNEAGIILTEVNITKQKDNLKIISLPTVNVKLDFSRLVYGKATFEEIIINNPNFIIEDIFSVKESLEDKPQAPYVINNFSTIISAITGAIKGNNNEIPIKSIKMNGVGLQENTAGTETHWYFPSITFGVEDVGHVYQFSTSVEGLYKENIFKFDAIGDLQDDGSVKVRSRILNMSPSLIVQLFPNFSFYSELSHKIKGESSFSIAKDGMLSDMEFTMHLGGADATESGMLDITGKLKLYSGYKEYLIAPEISARAVVRNLNMEDLAKFWPASFAPQVRLWVTSRIQKGKYSRAEAIMKISPEEFIAQEIKPDSIAAIVAFEDAELNYYEGLPIFYNASGYTKFSRGVMDMKITKGRIKGSNLNSGYISINKVEDDNFKITINGSFDGGVQDLVEFYDIDNQEADSKTKDFLKAITGDAKTELAINFLISENEEDVKDFDVKLISHLQDVYTHNIDYNLEIAKGELDIILHNDVFSLKGDGLLNGITSTVEYYQQEGENKEEESHYTVKMTLNGSQDLAKFNLDSFNAIDGAFDVTYHEIRTDNNRRAFIGADLSKAKINIPLIGFNKDVDIPLKAKVILSDLQQQDMYVIKSFSLEGEGVDIAGNASISSKEDGYFNFVFDRLQYGNNDANVSFSRVEKDYYKISVKGVAIDLESLIAYKEELTDLDDAQKEVEKENNINSAYKQPFALDIVLDVEKVFMANEIQIYNMRGLYKQKKESLENIMLEGQFSNGGGFKVHFDDLSRGGDQYTTLSLNSDHAGAFLSALDLSTHVVGGLLEISAKQPAESNDFEEGKIIMKKFSIVKAPILGKIFSLASFSGILDALNGKGIIFSKLKGEFNIKKNFLYLTDMKMSGDAIGITAQGNIDIKNKIYDLTGSVVPAYGINSFLGKVPLLGKILIGKEGEGIIASRFSIKDSMSNPNVTVNPFSMLTPGFLRGIWGESSSEEKPEEEIED